MNTKLSAGLNGFGRFGLNLLAIWWEDPNPGYQMNYINDETLKPQQIAEALRSDSIVKTFRGSKVQLLSDDRLVIQSPNGRTANIHVTNENADRVSWLGKPTFWFECSGSLTVATRELCSPFLTGNTQHVLVSATAYQADVTLIYGFNHTEFEPIKHKIVSYGSCTVNPGIVLADAIHSEYGVDWLSVNVIHNIQQYRIDSGLFNTLQRKSCTLETVAPIHLPFLSNGRIKVSYTVIPWAGASTIDFWFSLNQTTTRRDFVAKLQDLTGPEGPLSGLIELVPHDRGPESVLESRFSMTVVEEWIQVVGDRVLVAGYFYNEGSGSRYHDVANYIASRLQGNS